MSLESATMAPAGCDTEPDRRPTSIKLVTPLSGTLWFGAWLFTIGFAQLSFGKGLLALVIWPYYLGVLAR